MAHSLSLGTHAPFREPASELLRDLRSGLPGLPAIFSWLFLS